MDHKHFDTLTRALSEAGTRRGLLGILATLPVLGGLFALLDGDETDAKGRRKRRKKAHKHGKGRRRKHHMGKCKAKSRAKTCAGTCGKVRNNCKKTVDCGQCPCAGLSPTDDLQAAIDAAAPGSTVTLCPGTWRLTARVFIDKDLTLRGAGAELTVLDGGDAVLVLEIETNVAVLLEQLTITNGRSSDGAGIHNSGNLTLREMVVTGNTANQGGGIFSFGTMTLQAGARVVGNSAIDGAGILNVLESVTLQAGSEVSGNHATGSGGGIFTGAGTVTVEEGALVCDNEQATGGQCDGQNFIGSCPNPADGICPA